LGVLWLGGFVARDDLILLDGSSLPSRYRILVPTKLSGCAAVGANQNAVHVRDDLGEKRGVGAQD